MNRYFWTIGLAIVSQVGYHLGQRSVPNTASPFVVLASAYGAACVLCLVFLPIVGQTPTAADLRASVGWPTWIVALSIVGIELGYLLAYRSGWTIGLAFAVASTITVVALALVAAAFLGSPLSARRLAGIALACMSLWLLVTGGENS